VFTKHLIVAALLYTLCADVFADAPISPIPIAPLVASSGKTTLGGQLFSDARLSHDNSISCVDCHALNFSGADGRRVGKGIKGATGRRNVPSVFNAALNFRQFWDGRAESLEDQIDGPISDPLEMGSSWSEIVGKLNADPQIRNAFQKAYATDATEASVKDAIASFERTLTTPNSRFDRFLRGDEKAISASERGGYELFKGYGCIACHQGVNVGGNMFQVFGVMGNIDAYAGSLSRDLGRFDLTHNQTDRHVFKVPSLRNVAVTGPYFHDGSVHTLEQAVDVMVTYQLGRTAPEGDKALIVQFLGTLTGEYQGKALTQLKTAP